MIAEYFGTAGQSRFSRSR
jgi:hypothetical protein